MDIPLSGSFCPLFPDRIGIQSVSFFWREEIQRKTLRARMRTNNNLNPQVTKRSGIKPRPHWQEASTLSTAPSLLVIHIVHYTFLFSEDTYLDKVLPFWVCKRKLQSSSVAENKTWLKEKFIIQNDSDLIFDPQNESQQIFADNNDINYNDNNSATHKAIILFTLSTLTLAFIFSVLFSFQFLWL